MSFTGRAARGRMAATWGGKSGGDDACILVDNSHLLNGVRRAGHTCAACAYFANASARAKSPAANGGPANQPTDEPTNQPTHESIIRNDRVPHCQRRACARQARRARDHRRLFRFSLRPMSFPRAGNRTKTDCHLCQARAREARLASAAGLWRAIAVRVTGGRMRGRPGQVLANAPSAFRAAGLGVDGERRAVHKVGENRSDN